MSERVWAPRNKPHQLSCSNHPPLKPFHSNLTLRNASQSHCSVRSGRSSSILNPWSHRYLQVCFSQLSVARCPKCLYDWDKTGPGMPTSTFKISMDCLINLPVMCSAELPNLRSLSMWASPCRVYKWGKVSPWKCSGPNTNAHGKLAMTPKAGSLTFKSGFIIHLHWASVNVVVGREYSSFLSMVVVRDCQARSLGRWPVQMLSAQSLATSSKNLASSSMFPSGAM